MPRLIVGSAPPPQGIRNHDPVVEEFKGLVHQAVELNKAVKEPARFLSDLHKQLRGLREQFSQISGKKSKGTDEGLIGVYRAETKKILSEIEAKLSFRKLESLGSAILPHITVEGIFRTSGDGVEVNILAEKLNREPTVDLSKEKRDTLVGVFKKILKELDFPPPLASKQGELLSIDVSKKSAKAQIKKVVSGLNELEYKITELVIKLLSEIAKQSSANKMDSNKLAKIIAPNFFEFPEDYSIAKEMTDKMTSLVEFMIEKSKKIFK